MAPAFIDPDRFQRAAARFIAFFRELEEVFVERGDLLTQVALGLLGREHVLITGPPGTAKSQVASVVLRRILGEKTGAPSVYTRQFTESTVQTDLVGPLDFKTLMETGRTEHFTDEGMLGSVHAFLDEVFDGRDMLLRSTLNLLQERELKEGSRTTRGQIECALMTSNRYLAEILEGSRETLLAFVDRIAYVNFVPKGFADTLNLALVLKRSLGGKIPTLMEPLAIEDLDVLQAVVDQVYVPDAICDVLAKLLEMLDGELTAAAKADPGFVPTRYLSTRTAVRAGRVLRAICVYDKLFAAPERPLEVMSRDFKALRLHLVLGGLEPARARAMLGRELDPRERRQLQILCTEREIFERCAARLPTLPPSVPAARPDPARLERLLGSATLRALDADDLAQAARELAAHTMAGDAGADQAARRFRDAVATLGERALRAGLQSELGTVPENTAREMAALADTIEGLSPSTRPLACWLRGRAVWLLDQTIAAPGLSAQAAELAAGGAHSKKVDAGIEERIATLERMASMRRDLVRLGADAADGVLAWRVAAQRLEDELVLLLDGGFRNAVREVLAGARDLGADEVLFRLAPALRKLGEHDARLEAFGLPAGHVTARVCSERMKPLVRALFPAKVAPSERSAFVEQVDGLLAHLREAGLDGVMAPGDLVAWTAAALVAGGDGAPVDGAHPDRDGYRQLVVNQGPSAAGTLVGVATRRVFPALPDAHERPAEIAAAIARLLSDLPPKLRDGIAALDLVAAEHTLDYLERWWNAAVGPDGGEPTAKEVVARVEAVVASGFLRVVRDEAAPARVAASTRRLAELFPACDAAARELAGRAARLDETCTRRLVDLLTRRSDAAWATVLAKP